MAASEAAPFAKTGGLADVLGALPPALAARGEQVAVVLPRYRGIPAEGLRRVWDSLEIYLSGTMFRVDILEATQRGVSYYFADCPPLFDRPGIYGEFNHDYGDNALRFALFSRAVLGVARFVFRPDILHTHDWQAGLVHPFLRHTYASDPTYFPIKTVMSIHNIGYQGVYPAYLSGALGIDAALLRPDLLEFHGNLNYLKGGIVFADAITTVSPAYAREIQTPEFGFGLDGLLRASSNRLTGILNGADYDEWNPATDPHIAANYSVDDVAGKEACKRDLLATFGLPEELDRPVIGIVSRFATQKGFDLIAQDAHRILEQDVALVALGMGEHRYQDLFRYLAAVRPLQVGVRIGYDNALAHKIEAGADIFLMPSRYEPCGLNQIYSLRYGTVPVVRATGGLDDTIEEDTGVKFRNYDGTGLLWAVGTALAKYRDRDGWRAMMLAGMRKDFSWDASAVQYSALYRRLLGA